ncbi:MAG: carboxymuconolactone decarboxylase family protein [Candidatus Synoicihabitans palmerolidicus]|nr:carboxymuconolactone decarboxylase family protein [Candidatus Synoicihabitans palmerolidicus]
MTHTLSSPLAGLAPLSPENAPDASHDNLAAAQKRLGFVPNLLGVFAHVPALLEGYTADDAAFSRTSFKPSERQLILLAVSVVNECDYCVAAHSTIAKSMLKVDADTVAAIRAGTPLPDARQNALINLVRELVEARGHASTATIQAFLDAGYRREQVFKIILGIVQQTSATISTIWSRCLSTQFSKSRRPDSHPHLSTISPFLLP